MVSLDIAKNITCSNCIFNEDCPLGGNRNFCSPHFVMCMYNNDFNPREISDIKVLCKWRDIYKTDKSLKTQCSAFADALSTQFMNRELKNPKSIILYAIANKIVNECKPFEKIANKINEYNNEAIIRPIVPWFSAKRAIEKKFSNQIAATRKIHLVDNIGENNQR